uniref:Peptidoglycan transglycosylase n=1 Tax=Escherichia virus LS3 TaxID=2743777 RepID=A0A7D5JH80_9CAUD
MVAATGIPATQSLDLSNPDTLSALAQAISFHETGSRYNPEVYQKGVERALNGISPKTPPVSANVFDALTEGLKAKPKVALGENLPNAAGLNIEGQASEAPNESFGEMFYKSTGETMQEREDRSTWFGFGEATKAEVKNSMIGVAIRAGQTEDSLDVIGDVFNPTRWNNHKWSREELDQIRNAGVLPQYYGVITGGSPQNLTELINLALENQKLDQEKAKAGIGAQLAAGVIGAGVDPLTYVPIAGQVGKGGKLVNKMFTVAAQSGALSGVSEMARTSVAGGDAHVAEAILGGALFGGGMTAIADGLGRALGRNTNEFAGPATRLEARETARNVDGQDLSRLPIQEGEQTFSHQGVKFADVPNEPGSVRLEDGSILIGENPLNPKTRQVFDEVIEPERAAAGVNLGGLTEIGLKLLRSENPEIRGVAADLVRSPTGMQSGPQVKSGPLRQTYSRDFVLWTIGSTTTSTMLLLRHSRTLTSRQHSGETLAHSVKTSISVCLWLSKMVAETAIEDGSGNLKAELTTGELKVYDLLKNQFDAKREMMENPAMFGRQDAQSIFPVAASRGPTSLMCIANRKELYIKELGSPEALQEAIKKSWLTSYASRPEVKKRVDEALLEADPTLTPEGLAAAVDKYANDKAYGISHTEQFERSSVMEENINGLVGLENNSFLEARNLFDSDMSIVLPNGQTFSVNNLREWDMDKIVPAYNRRVNGDIAIMAGTGKTTKDMKDLVETMMNKAGDDGKLKGEVSTLRDTLKILTGRARRDGADDAAFATVMRTMTDLSFFAKNAYMGVQNLTEIGGMLARGNVRAMLHGVPMFRDLAFRNKKVGASEIKDLHNVIFGKELDDSIRPSKQDVIDRLRSYSDLGRWAATALGTAKYYTGELAVRSPFTKVLNGTTNYLLDAGRQGFLSDIVEHSLTGSKRRFDDRWLKTAGISDEQWKGIKSLISESVTRGPDGKYTIKDKKAFSQDPRAMDLWRMGDTIADETLLRPHKLSNMDAKAYGPLAKTVLQFKNFVIKSINGRTMRTFYNATKNNRAMDAALSTVISMGLAGIYYMAQAHVKAYAMQDGRDRDYLKQALDPTMIGYAALSRSSHLGGPLGVANILGGIAGYEDTKMLRSSILPRSPTEKPERAIAYGAATSDPVMNVVGNFLEQVPAFGYAANVGASAYNLAGYLKADTRVNERDYMTGMYNTFRELVPNDPITQKLLLGTFEEQGIHIKD